MHKRAKREKWARNVREAERPYIPSVVIGNVRSIQNGDRADELVTLMTTQSEYKHSSLICLTESWLNSDCPDMPITADGFSLIRADRLIEKDNGKLKRGGGIAVYINKDWCKEANATVKKQICNPDIELLGIILRPTYLPRELSCVVLLTVYCPPNGNAASAQDTISRVVPSTSTSIGTRANTGYFAVLVLVQCPIPYSCSATDVYVCYVLLK